MVLTSRRSESPTSSANRQTGVPYPVYTLIYMFVSGFQEVTGHKRVVSGVRHYSLSKYQTKKETILFISINPFTETSLTSDLDRERRRRARG